LHPKKTAGLIQKSGIKFSFIQNCLNLDALQIKTLITICVISMLRAVVFVLQLILVMFILNQHLNIEHAFYAGGVYFGLLTISPSLVFNKLGIREALSVVILAPVTMSPVAAALSVFVLWFINQVIPVILGSVFLIKKSVHRA
jgi:hypothetical protein